MIVTTTTTVCTCDRCGYVKDSVAEHNAGVTGEMRIDYAGHTGGRTIQGDWGGSSKKGNAWLCFNCAQDFIDFMANAKLA